MENVKITERTLKWINQSKYWREQGLVYCTKCGFKNEDDAKVCAKCGAPLQISRSEGRRRSNDECFGSHERDWEHKCFGLPHAGSVAGLVFGFIIVLIGIAIILEKSIWNLLWPFIIIIFGSLIIIGALYGRRRRY